MGSDKDIESQISQMYDDYLLIKKMRASISTKIKMMTVLFEEYKGAWKVVGITREALEIFKDSNFEYRPHMRINRAHLVDRKDTYAGMLKNDLSKDEWWEMFQRNDRCVLATATQNMKDSISDYIQIDGDKNLFKMSGKRWRHTKKEEKLFLQMLYNDLV